MIHLCQYPEILAYLVVVTLLAVQYFIMIFNLQFLPYQRRRNFKQMRYCYDDDGDEDMCCGLCHGTHVEGRV